MATDFGIGTAANVAAANVAGPIIGVVIEKMKDVIEMGENVRHLKTDFTRMQGVLDRIENQFREQQRALPEPVQNCLERIRDELQKVKDLIDASEAQPRCLGCYCSLRNPKLPTQIRDWKTGFDRLFEELERDFKLCVNAAQIVADAPLQVDDLRQPVSVSRLIGSAIESAQKVQAWLGESHPQPRMVGVYGMGGVGKTTILQLIYNHFQKGRGEGRGIFDKVFWLTISQKYEITELQASMAETLGLNLKDISDKTLRKMKLYASLRGKKFLLILDDLWHSIDLAEIGVTLEDDHNCSKVLMASRSSDVIGAMGASADYSLRIQPLSPEKGLEFFTREAFTNGVVPNDSRQGIAREIAMECQGLPLALKVVAAAMRSKTGEDEWKRALNLMKVDPSFLIRHGNIDAELYKPLKWSYDELTDPNLNICFLYCAVFPEDAQIDVETLVQMWSAENLVTHMDAGHVYIDALVGKCLFEYVSDDDRKKVKVHKIVHHLPISIGDDGKKVKVHDILHDLAICIGRSEENCLFASGQHLQDFPSEGEIRNCKRISVGHNDIRVLPTSLACPELVSLVLANNKEITEVKEGFLSAAMSLKVLDLSHTNITTLPTTLGQLEQLEFLNLSHCSSLRTLPKSTGNLSSLRFLNLEGCGSLNSLPDNIGNLRNLKHLNLDGCNRLMAIPHGISHLTSLNKLFLPLRDGYGERYCAINVEYIANLSNLMELTATLECKNIESTMTTWTELRRLEVSCVYDADRDHAGRYDAWDLSDTDDVGEEYLRDDADRDDVGEEHIFPFNMDNLNKLEHFILSYYKGLSLPSCIPQFQNLRVLQLYQCDQLGELPGIVGGGFPMLKSVSLWGLSKLESMMVGSSVLSSEETMPQLEDIEIVDCSSLKRLTTRKLPRLKQLRMQHCPKLEALKIESCGLPMLEDLTLDGLLCETIVGPPGVINDGVMPKLQRLHIVGCPSLRRLVLEKLSNLRDIFIQGCNELRELAVGSGGFPALETLHLSSCPKVENMAGPYDVWDENTMPQLRSLEISRCPLVRRLPRGMEKLSRLQQIRGDDEWWQNLIWEDENVKNRFFLLFC